MGEQEFLYFPLACIVSYGIILLVEKKNKRSKQKELKVKLAFVFDKGGLVKLEEIKLALLQREDKKVNQSEIIKRAVDDLWKKVCKT